MTDDFYENAFRVIAVIAVLVAATFVLLFPQAFGFTVYRLLRRRSKPFAALIGFLLPLISYCLFFKYFWYDGLAQQPAGNPLGSVFFNVLLYPFGVYLLLSLASRFLKRKTSAAND